MMNPFRKWTSKKRALTRPIIPSFDAAWVAGPAGCRHGVPQGPLPEQLLQAFCVVGASTSWPSVRDEFDKFPDAVFGVVPGNVGLTEDADQIVAVDDREAADLMLLHGPDRFLDGIVGPDRGGLALAKLPGSGRAGVPAVCQALGHDVPVRQHALEPVVFAADRQ